MGVFSKKNSRFEVATHPLQEWTAPKSLEIDKDNLRMKFSALNVHFNSVRFAISTCSAHLEWIFAEITGDKPRQPAYKIKLMLSRVSWALAKIYCSIYTLDLIFIGTFSGKNAIKFRKMLKRVINGND